MKYAYIKDNGQLLGWYDENIHASIPTPNIEVSDEVWQNAVNLNHNKINADGTTENTDFRSSAEIAQYGLKKIKAEALVYLASTDWITSKYNDVVTVLEQMSKEDFVAKYREIYDNRITARAVVGGE